MHPDPSAPSSRPVARAGAVCAYQDPRAHAALGHRPIAFVAMDLWHALTALAIAPAAAEATAEALLREIAADATDAALIPGNERAPHQDLWVSAPAYIGGARRVIWFQQSHPGGPLTAYYAPAPQPGP
ncbi:hypothetical protein [Kitasatospora nipponensis]